LKPAASAARSRPPMPENRLTWVSSFIPALAGIIRFIIAIQVAKIIREVHAFRILKALRVIGAVLPADQDQVRLAHRDQVLSADRPLQNVMGGHVLPLRDTPGAAQAGNRIALLCR